MPNSDDRLDFSVPVHGIGPKPPVPACDFCSRPGAIVYFATAEYFIDLPTYTWASGDRFYACPTCRILVDAGDWPGLIAYAGLGARGAKVVEGFRDHHTPGAVAFEPGSHPEHSR